MLKDCKIKTTQEKTYQQHCCFWTFVIMPLSTRILSLGMSYVLTEVILFYSNLKSIFNCFCIFSNQKCACSTDKSCQRFTCASIGPLDIAFEACSLSIGDWRILRLLHRILQLTSNSQWLFSIQTWSLFHNILLYSYTFLLLLEFLAKILFWSTLHQC